MLKCLFFRHFEQWKHIQSLFTRKFGEVLAQTTACGRDDLFFALHLILNGKLGICGRDDFFLLFTWFWEENWPFADVITFEEPVRLLCRENMVILPIVSSVTIIHVYYKHWRCRSTDSKRLNDIVQFWFSMIFIALCLKQKNVFTWYDYQLSSVLDSKAPWIFKNQHKHHEYPFIFSTLLIIGLCTFKLRRCYRVICDCSFPCRLFGWKVSLEMQSWIAVKILNWVFWK